MNNNTLKLISFKEQTKFVEKLLKHKRNGKISPEEFMNSLLSRTYYNDSVFEQGKGKKVSILLAEAYGNKILTYDEYSKIITEINLERS